jgi:hypothetical protein
MTLGKNCVLDGSGAREQHRARRLFSVFRAIVSFVMACRVGSAHQLGFASVMLTPRQSNWME